MVNVGGQKITRSLVSAERHGLRNRAILLHSLLWDSSEALRDERADDRMLHSNVRELPREKQYSLLYFPRLVRPDPRPRSTASGLGDSIQRHAWVASTRR